MGAGGGKSYVSSDPVIPSFPTLGAAPGLNISSREGLMLLLLDSLLVVPNDNLRHIGHGSVRDFDCISIDDSAEGVGLQGNRSLLL